MQAAPRHTSFLRLFTHRTAQSTMYFHMKCHEVRNALKDLDSVIQLHKFSDSGPKHPGAERQCETIVKMITTGHFIMDQLPIPEVIASDEYHRYIALLISDVVFWSKLDESLSTRYTPHSPMAQQSSTPHFDFVFTDVSPPRLQLFTYDMSEFRTSRQLRSSSHLPLHQVCKDHILSLQNKLRHVSTTPTLHQEYNASKKDRQKPGIDSHTTGSRSRPRLA
jgi:hypothetical protein